MPPPIIHGHRLGDAYDATWWRSVYALYDECFPGLPAGIERAQAAGASWRSVSTPFVAMEEGRALAHVGVVAHPMVLNGGPVATAGIHAVCTTSNRRRQGLARHLLSEALAWADERFPVAKLHTDRPAVYAPHGFRPVATHRFVTPILPANPGPKRLLQPLTRPTDARLLARLLATRTPPSERCATADTGWLDTIVAGLNGVISSGFWLLKDHDAVVVLGRDSTATLILDVIATKLPSAAIVMGAASHESLPAVWTFAPDLFHAASRPIRPVREPGVFMVRGDWPLTEPFGISPLWEH